MSSLCEDLTETEDITGAEDLTVTLLVQNMWINKRL